VKKAITEKARETKKGIKNLRAKTRRVEIEMKKKKGKKGILSVNV